MSKMTERQFGIFQKLMDDCRILDREETSEYLQEVYNTTDDEDVKFVCRAYWRTEQNVADIQQKAEAKLHRRPRLRRVK